jgi:UV excision repair protein RAD23
MNCCLIFHFIQLAQQQQQPTPSVAPGLGGLGATPAAPGLDALRADPRLNAIRELASQNPALLQPVLQQIMQNNPQLAQTLASNPDELLNHLLNAGDDDEPIPPGAQVVNVTAEERAAIERVSFLPYLPD